MDITVQENIDKLTRLLRDVLFLNEVGGDAQYVYQKIADPRVDNPNTNMTVNLATKLFNEKEICDITSYVLSIK